RWGPSAHPGALGLKPTQRREASRHLRRDAPALIGAHSHPALNFRKATPATDAKRRARIDCAHFVAGALDVGHGSSRRCGGQDKKSPAEDTNPHQRTAPSPPMGATTAAADWASA